MTTDPRSTERAVPTAHAIMALRKSWERARRTETLRDKAAVWAVPIFVAAGILWGLARKESGAVSSWGLLDADRNTLPYAAGVVLLVIAASAFPVLKAIGPMAVGSAEMHWMLSSPVDRAALLRRQMIAWVVGTAVTGVFVARFVTLMLPTPTTWWLFAALGVVSAWGVWGLAVRSQGKWDRCALTKGAEVATGFSASLVSLDPSHLSSAWHQRSWRRVGSVRSRGFAGGHTHSLVEADFRRVLRERSSQVTFVVALGASYAAALVGTPLAVALVQTIACFAVGSAFSRGLLDVCRSAELRNLLGGADRRLQLIHLPVPTAAIALLWLATMPVAMAGGWAALVVTPITATLAMYRSRTRPPMQYGGTVLETGFGQVPLDVLRQMVRGPAILVAGLFLLAVLL